MEGLFIAVVDLYGEVGGWVGGWMSKLVGIGWVNRLIGNGWVTGWVGGWVGGLSFTYLEVLPFFPVARVPAWVGVIGAVGVDRTGAVNLCERRGGWVGGLSELERRDCFMFLFSAWS